MTQRRTQSGRRGACPARAAFTTIELSVSVAIIGVIASVILPAVFHARESARRSQCSSNLRQQGIALHGFHETHRHFPPGWNSIQFSDDGAILRPADLGCLWAWGAHLLPYLDQSALYEHLGVSGFRDPPQPGDRLDASLGAFLCPSDTRGSESGWGLYRWDPDEETSVLVKGYANSNYVAASGSDISAFFKVDPSDTGRTAGMFGNETTTELADILDGTSNTFAIGERACLSNDQKEPSRGAIWIRNVGQLIAVTPAPESHLKPNSLVTGQFSLWPFAAINCDANSVVGLTSRDVPLNRTPYGFSSQHPGGANFLMADGAVRFISESIDAATYENLGSMADGQVLGEF